MSTTLRLVPMTEEQYRTYRLRAEENYAENMVASGWMSMADARRKAAEDFARLLTDGRSTEGHHLWIAYDETGEVGMIWLQIQHRSDGLHAFVCDFEVRAELRRRGHGRAIMQAAEEVCREMGMQSVGLNVFGHNAGARSLYDQLGFEVAAVQMYKRL